jgi:hypothetical protein
VHVGVERDVVHELVVLLLGRQLTVPEQPGNLQKGGIFGQLLDGISPITKNPLVAVDVGDRASTGGCVEERWIVAHETGVIGTIGLDLLELGGADGAFHHRNRVGPGGAVVLYL